ncbi:uncharacterized protein LOC121369874 [Gigantopelta aegis]|uniref:uncharacterized protein LOC121369874 n=1 Tax=Gigantopelta aegis TaxID=1735272 RepID=UPI001B888117|nr:uncharacterized protein LOC121369874 [Gigantopelta aegis]
METMQLSPKNKVEFQYVKNSTLPEIHMDRSKFRTLGRTPKSSAAFTHKRTENDFHVMRSIIEMSEIRKANAKKAQQIDEFKAQDIVSKYRDRGSCVDTSDTVAVHPRPSRHRSKSLLKNRRPERFTLSHVKKMSIADFKLSQQMYMFTPTCSRKDNPDDLLNNRNSMHCDLFGPGLCPDCQRLEARDDFTRTQNELFPFLDAHPRSLVAESKIRSLFNPRIVKSSMQITGRKDVGWNILRNVCTEYEICNRVKNHSRVMCR